MGSNFYTSIPTSQPKAAERTKNLSYRELVKVKNSENTTFANQNTTIKYVSYKGDTNIRLVTQAQFRSTSGFLRFCLF